MKRMVYKFVYEGEVHEYVYRRVPLSLMGKWPGKSIGGGIPLSLFGKVSLEVFYGEVFLRVYRGQCPSKSSGGGVPVSLLG